MLQEKNLGVFFLSKDCEIILKKLKKILDNKKWLWYKYYYREEMRWDTLLKELSKKYNERFLMVYKSNAPVVFKLFYNI